MAVAPGGLGEPVRGLRLGPQPGHALQSERVLVEHDDLLCSSVQHQ